MKQKEINNILNALVNNDITMKEAENMILDLISDMPSYVIEEDGKRLKGKILGMTKDGLEVRWSDGITTFEREIDPKHVVLD